MPTYTLRINQQQHSVDVAEGTPLLWVLREHLGLTGTKYGCGILTQNQLTINNMGSRLLQYCNCYFGNPSLIFFTSNKIIY